jgi:hypothetical protein
MNCLCPLKHWDHGFKSNLRDGCLCVFCVCAVLYAGRDRLIPCPMSPSDCVKRSRNWKSGHGPTMGYTATMVNCLLSATTNKMPEKKRKHFSKMILKRRRFWYDDKLKAKVHRWAQALSPFFLCKNWAGNKLYFINVSIPWAITWRNRGFVHCPLFCWTSMLT